ncbi:MAG: hypothetical protein A2275_16755 [Bacteroidetes bacterium RIFOXYA12_FULL_35_11]|nr:MAG: hypothetical protein A2X01_03205 [Bacteroidetes bacterium GWF2_35_48]OFY82456.1 MAG: hypothetical protein A2275_16755 [Bacteroidetes bacterium RIFOXYA12_FULL_35_11]OFZ00006.1 MAG: hypothetical protein A2491_00735 [Bacteroidetes bacterium RIFOXYC12_FULL_35_7]HBX51430.1 hypothetical protein [Bacteroidales bacterium]
MKSKLLYILFFLFFGAASFSQEVLTLDQAVGFALQKNFDILISRNDSLIASMNNSTGNAGMLPKVSLNLGDNYSLNNVNQELNSGSEINKTNAGSNALNASVVLNWTLFDGMKMFANREKLKSLEEQGQLNLKNKIQKTIGAVIVAYYNVVYQKQQIKVQEQINKISEERVKLGSLRFENGSSSKAEMLQAKVDLNAGKAALLQLNTMLLQKKTGINQLIGQNAEADFDVSDEIPINLGLNLNDLLSKSASGNFSVLISENYLKISQTSRKEVNAQRLPTVSFSAAYNYQYTKNDAGLILLNNTLGPSVGISVTIPLFNGFNATRQVKTATIDILSRQTELEKIKLQVSNEVFNAFKSYSLHLEALKLEEENITLAQENLDLSLARIKLSQATSLEVITAQNSLVAAYNRLLAAKLNAKIAETELLILSGELMK